VTTSLSNGLPETGTEAHTVCHVYIVRYKAQDELGFPFILVEGAKVASSGVVG
jgi:hypothetical protein